MSEETLNLLLGDEYDHDLIARTWSLLTAMGGRKVDAIGFLAGSQEVAIYIWDLKGAALRFETETYMGFSIEGPAALVTDLAARLASGDAQAP